MKNARLAGRLAALAVLLILVTAAPALAADLPLVSSTSYATAANDGFTCTATAEIGVVYAAGFAERNDSGDQSRLLLVKYVDDGASLTESWHQTAGADMSAVKVAVDASGDVIVAGNKGDFAFHGNGSDIVVIKYSATGERLWTATYDGPAHGLDYVKGLALDAHGNAIVCGASFGGRTGRDYVTLKVTAGGKRMWARRYAGPSDFDEARDVAVDLAGNVYVTGQSRGKPADPRYSGTLRAVTIAYSPAGGQRWMVIDTRGRSAAGAAIDYTGAGGVRSVVLSGSRVPSHGNRARTYFEKFRTDGKLLWTRTLDPGIAAMGWVTAGGLDGTGAPVAAGFDGQVAGVSATGSSPWGSSYVSAFTNPPWAEFDALDVAADGRILAVGNTASGEMPEQGDLPTTYLVRYSPGWPITAPLDYTGGGGATTENACSAAVIGDKGMYAVGKAAEGSEDSDAVLLKF